MSSEKDLDVVTVGHVLVDIRFVVERFAGPDQEVPIRMHTRSIGGSAANVAIGIRRLGRRSAVVAKVGLDSFGRLAIEELMKEGVDVSGVKVALGDTGFSIVIIDSKGSIAIYGFKGVAEELKPNEVDEDVISRAKFVHIASLRPDTSLRAAQLAREYGAKVSWDPGRVLSRQGLQRLEQLVKVVDMVLLNEEECKCLTGEADYKSGARKLLSLGPSLVVVKRGAKGVFVLGEGIEDEVPAFKVKVVDSTGAGDAFAAGLLAALSRGYSMKRALLYAMATAALKITRLGSHEVPSHEEVIKFLWERLEEAWR